MKKIKIAQIGTGHDHAADAVTVLKNLNDIFEIIGFAEVPEDKFNTEEYRYEKRKSAYDGIEKISVDEILNHPDLDAVLIETEDRALTKYASLAAEKGLHIHMDKPGGIDENEYDRLIDKVKEKNLVFQTGYMYRYNPALLRLKKDIKAGKLGEIISIEARMSCRHDVKKRQWLGDFPGGMLYFLGCHMIDFIYSVLGSPKEVIPLSISSDTDNVKAEDFGMAVFKYRHGISIAQSSAVETGGFDRRQIVVCGTKGTVEISPPEITDSNYAEIFVPVKSRVREAFSDKTNTYFTEVVGRYDAMFRAFAEYVCGKAVNPYDYEYERELHKLILKACGK